jgi:hypothetical protein
MSKNKLILFSVIFIIGLIFFNQQVADACTHGNCIHGWDSKNTKGEQGTYRLWFFGFPAAIFAYYWFVKKDN